MTKTKNSLDSIIIFHFQPRVVVVVVVDGAHFRPPPLPPSPSQNRKQASGTKVMWGLKLLYLGNKVSFGGNTMKMSNDEDLARYRSRIPLARYYSTRWGRFWEIKSAFTFGLFFFPNFCSNVAPSFVTSTHRVEISNLVLNRVSESDRHYYCCCLVGLLKTGRGALQIWHSKGEEKDSVWCTQSSQLLPSINVLESSNPLGGFKIDHLKQNFILARSYKTRSQLILSCFFPFSFQP